MDKTNDCKQTLYITKISDFINKEIQNEKRIIIIPKFQRQYCWNKKHFKNFFNDITKSKYINCYFLGTYIIYEENKNLLVIDGQQRLITTLILLMSLYISYKKRNRFLKSNTWVNNIGEMMRQKEIIKFKYEYHNKCWNSIVQIFSGTYEENNFEIPKTEIDKIINKEDSISKCFSYYFKKFSCENDDKKDIILNNIKNIQFCIFKIDSEKEAILNFLKVNTIIQPLKKFDIFKGRIYEKYNDSESENISKKLNEIQEKINYSDLDKFLTFFITCKKGKKISKSDLDTEVSNQINEDIEKLIEELKKYSLIYTALLDKSENNFEKEIPDQLKCSFYLIREFGYRQIMPIFTIVFFKIKESNIIKETNKNILNIIENLMKKILVYMIYEQVIQREKGSIPRAFFNELIKKFFSLDFKNDYHYFQNEAKNIFAYIKNKTHYDNSLLEKYITNLYLDNKKDLNKKIIRWILFEYYSDLINSDFLLDYKTRYDFIQAILSKNKKVTIEHIIDEKINDVDKYLSREDGEIYIDFKEYIDKNKDDLNKIWNLTFLKSNLNNKLGTDSKKNFFNKINYYKTDNSSFLSKEINLESVEKNISNYDFLKIRKKDIINFVTDKLFV